MAVTMELGGITVDVVRKDIKNIHLSVYPPTGRVRISAPDRMSIETIRLFAISRLGWIKKQQEEVGKQEREPKREYLDRESHYVWGSRYLLKVVERDAAPQVMVQHDTLLLQVRPGADATVHESVLATWYRQLLKIEIARLVKVWEPRLSVTVSGVFVQQMKTKWGSCNPASGTIRLNTELAKKPKECLEYIVVHEMAHLIERTHGPRFVATIDRVMPTWRETQDLLKRLPVSHQEWSY